GCRGDAGCGRCRPGLSAAWYVDQLDGGLVKRGRVVGEPAPVRVRLFGDDFPLLDQPLDHLVDLKPVTAVVQADADVLEIKKDGERPLAVRMPWFHSGLV